ncbi:putative YkwD family protein/spore coat assembly protein SafA [Paenibacillus sp. V4I3]|uniref:CAP domain-containing protein n=1 Tax=unclassified Paenibacillus TaxID=185978 RepID=UPI002781BF79|nr:MULTISPECIES: CAP domain-containing protein [unclassified Paenibacillus]MDQ0875711.1 putative YkwD family protein/spore coat assembly protein SafA [Paenibacillus sp. V4I3]MDQ0888219.1 putative YkwD family protein/spore coat assembly protein SafA [Paenibacillus sp. V4I9]
MKRYKKLVVTGAIGLSVLVGSSASMAASATHSVSGNDTMWLISKKYGISLSSLIKANPQVANPNVIWSGMSLNIPGSTSTNAGTKTPVTSAPSQSTYASQVVNLVNQERSKAGLRPLTSNSALTAMALDKAKDMYNNGYFDHTSPTYGSPFDMMSKYGIRYSYAGENIAKGQQTPEAVMKAWMNSTGHRQNILSPNFTQIGVVFYNGEWVQEFISN